MAVVSVPVVITNDESNPRAVFLVPVVFAANELVPTAVLLFAVLRTKEL